MYRLSNHTPIGMALPNQVNISYQVPAGSFQNAHDFIIQNPIMLGASHDIQFMKEFAEFTLRGAELDSSERDPPPRCHPGTRTEIVDHIQLWCHNPRVREKSMLWLVGPAGVGKSAIMQTVAELVSKPTSILATLFFSALNGRNDPIKVVATLSYQIALQHEAYRQHIRLKVTSNPKLWHKSIIGQFSEFIVEPFVKRRVHRGPNPILVFIDGLDECKGEREQILFLSLICYFITRFPDAPLLWIVASRPEAHITAHLSRRRLRHCFEKQEVSINSTDACRDVERFLRVEFENIRASNPFMSLYPRWPPENVFLKLVTAAVGLFAYAVTIIRFIGGSTPGDPISRLQLVINIIDSTPSPTPGIPSAQPMAQLDILYQYIISHAAVDDLPHAKEVLAAMIFDLPEVRGCEHRSKRQMNFFCDWLGLAPSVLYGTLRQFHAVVDVPLPTRIYERSLRFYHKSFSDFLLDPRRSGTPLGTKEDEYRRDVLRAARILKDIPYNDLPEPGCRPPRKYIRRFWLYNTQVGENISWDLHHCARRIFRGASDRMNILPLEDVAHCLKIAVDSSPDTLDEALLLSSESELVRHLERDRVLLDIPIKALDQVILHHSSGRTHSLDLVPPDASTLYSNVAYTGNSEILKLLEHTIMHRPQDAMVRGFIGNQLKGWILYHSITDKKFRFLDYDFSTIHHLLKN